MGFYENSRLSSSICGVLISINVLYWYSVASEPMCFANLVYPHFFQSFIMGWSKCFKNFSAHKDSSHDTCFHLKSPFRELLPTYSYVWGQINFCTPEPCPKGDHVDIGVGTWGVFLWGMGSKLGINSVIFQIGHFGQPRFLNVTHLQLK